MIKIFVGSLFGKKWVWVKTTSFCSFFFPKRRRFAIFFPKTTSFCSFFFPKRRRFAFNLKKKNETTSFYGDACNKRTSPICRSIWGGGGGGGEGWEGGRQGRRPKRQNDVVSWRCLQQKDFSYSSFQLGGGGGGRKAGLLAGGLSVELKISHEPGDGGGGR